MKWFTRIVDRFAARLAKHSPRLQRIAAKLSDNLEAVQEDRRLMKELAHEIALRKEQAEERLLQLRELRMAERMCLVPDRQLREAAMQVLGEAQATESNISTVFKERLWELELALEDRGWVRETTLAGLEFSRYGIQQLVRICRIYGIKNPIIKRIAEICELYVFGRGFEIKADDDAQNDVIQEFLLENNLEMGHNGLSKKENDIQTDGALYFGLPTDEKGKVRVLMVDALEIMDVGTDPDDTAHPQFLLRHWTRVVLNIQTGLNENQVMRSWYPSLEYLQSNPKQKPKNIGDVPVNWDMPILRDRAAGSGPSKWRWPVPPIYGAIDWARAYKDALEDYATVRRTLARFALMVETKGGPATIASYNALFNTSFADADGTQIERNPPPVTGSAHISGPGNQIQAFKSAGAQAHPEETRRILLMACSAAGMPETFFGDASTGSLATAVSLDRPTELKFTAIQRRWTHTIKMILQYVLDVSRTSPGGKMKEGLQANPAPQPVSISVKFPTVVEHQIQPMIQAITEVATMGGRNGIAAGIIDRRTIADLLLAEIGYEDRVELLDKIYGKSYKPANDVTDQRSQPAPQSITAPIGKALDALSIPPPLPPPPALAAPPPIPGAPPKPGAPLVKPVPGKPTKKEALVAALEAVRGVYEDE